MTIITKKLFLSSLHNLIDVCGYINGHIHHSLNEFKKLFYL